MHAGARSSRSGGGTRRPHHRPVGDRQDDDHLPKQNDSKPVQDDFLAVMPDGSIHATRTAASRRPSAGRGDRAGDSTGGAEADLVPRERLAEGGHARLLDTSYTQNGGPCSRCGHRRAGERAPSRRRHPPDPEPQRGRHPGRGAADGSAGGRLLHAGETRDERRRSRGGRAVPAHPGPTRSSRSTRPAGERLLQIMKATDGGLPSEHRESRRRRGDARSLKVKIRHSSAIVQGIAEGTIRWDRDPDFGYEVASKVPGSKGRRAPAPPARDVRAQGAPTSTGASSSGCAASVAST